jgi:hypothetical protein
VTWEPASNGAYERHWFVYAGDAAPVEERYYTNARGDLIRFASMEAAQRMADVLNAKQGTAGALRAIIAAWDRDEITLQQVRDRADAIVPEFAMVPGDVGEIMTTLRVLAGVAARMGW